MTKTSKSRKSEKKYPLKGYQPGSNGRPGRYYVRLNGSRQYLGKDGDPDIDQHYLEAVLQWEKNGRKPLPTHVKTGIPVEELATQYLGWVESAGYSPGYVTHIRIAMQFLIDQCGHLSTAEFTRHTLKSLQEKLEKEGIHGKPYCRESVNRYIRFMVNAFIEGEERGWGVDENLPGQLTRVRPLRIGRTTAPEYQEVGAVEIDVVKATLPFMSDTIRAMVMTQLLCTMRSQDIVNLRVCDVQMNHPKYPGVWFYEPHTHKTKKRGKRLLKVIPPEAQEILAPFIRAKMDTPTAFVFSPRDVTKKHREQLREYRKSKPTPSQIERAKRAKKRKPKCAPGEKYRVDSYRTAVQRAQGRARKAGVDVEHWFPHQLRHRSVTETRAKFGLKAARDMAGHSNSKVTKGYAKQKIERMVKVARKQSRIFS